MAYTMIIRCVNGMIIVRGIVSIDVTVFVNALGSGITIVIPIAIPIVTAMSGSLS